MRVLRRIENIVPAVWADATTEDALAHVVWQPKTEKGKYKVILKFRRAIVDATSVDIIKTDFPVDHLWFAALGPAELHLLQQLCAAQQEAERICSILARDVCHRRPLVGAEHAIVAGIRGGQRAAIFEISTL